MLIKVTNYCSLGCSHCMEESTVKGAHMTEDTFLAALEFTKRVESKAWAMGVPRRILLSGGEATEPPDFVRFLETVIKYGYEPLLITNGMWLNDPELKAAILRP